MKLAISCEGRSGGRLSRLRGGCPGVHCAFNRVLRRNLCFGDEAYRPCCTTARRCTRGISKPMSGFATATLMSSEERPLRGMHCLLDSRLSISRRMQQPAVQSLARREREGMLLTAPKGSWEFRFGLNTHDKWLHRLLPIKALLTTRTVGDYQAMPLPKSLWGLYYLTRPFRLVGHLAKKVFPVR